MKISIQHGTGSMLKGLKEADRCGWSGGVEGPVCPLEGDL